MSRLSTVLAVCIGASGLLAPPLAQAHFMLNSPTSWWTQASDGSPQKSAPCGNEGATGTAASKMVTTVQPGATVPVSVTATVAHPGWYRISLKQGASSTQTAAAFPDPAPLGAAGSAQQCTPAFMDNPVWSPTQPVLADKLGLPAGSTSTTTQQAGSKTFNVTIPSSATCTSAAPCTLQVLMFMTDHPSGSCNYHHCADIAVASADGGSGDAKADSGPSGSGGMITTGGTGGAITTAGTGGTITTTTGTGGATTTAGTGGTITTTTGTGGAITTAGTGGGAGTTKTGSDGDGGCAVSGGRSSTLAACVALLALSALIRRRRR